MQSHVILSQVIFETLPKELPDNLFAYLLRFLKIACLSLHVSYKVRGNRSQEELLSSQSSDRMLKAACSVLT